MPLDESLLTSEILANTLNQDVLAQIKVVAAPRKGKVRTMYDLGDEKLLMISSDNLSTHDVVHKRQVCAKGENLDAISQYYFDTTAHILPNHFQEQVASNTWLVHRAQPILVEMVFRQYLTGSGWKEYASADGPKKGMTFCGELLRPGYRKNEKLDRLLFTPTAKGRVHDFAIAEFDALNQAEDDPKITVDIIRKNYPLFGLHTPEDLDFIIIKAKELYQFIHTDLKQKGYLLADTKWEFGYLVDGSIVLIDECVTPDSSRFWKKAAYQFDAEKQEFVVAQDDKQHFRDHVEALGLHKDKKALATYNLPDEILRQGIIKYCTIREIITGTLPQLTLTPKREIILDKLDQRGYLNRNYILS